MPFVRSNAKMSGTKSMCPTRLIATHTTQDCVIAMLKIAL